MKAPTVTVRPSLGAVVGLLAVAIAAGMALPPARFSWWPWALIVAAAAGLLLVSVHRRNAASWVAAQLRWRWARRRTTPAAAAVDIGHGNAVYGVRTGPDEAVTVVRIDGRPDEPTFLRGSLSQTTNLIPLDVLTRHLDQPGGLRLGIDVVSVGFRVRPDSGYPALYSTLLAGRGAAGQRTTYLVVRLDLHRSVAGLSYRRSVGGAAAAATDRIVKDLNQHGVRAVAVSAEDHDAVLARLSLGLAAPPPRPANPDPLDLDDDPADADPDAIPGSTAAPSRAPAAATKPAAVQKIPPAVDVGWREINSRPGYAASFYFSPEDISTAAYTQMWALPSDDVVHVLMLRRRGAAVVVSALVRTNDPQPRDEPPTLFLNPLPGDQYAAALRAAPLSAPPLALPTADLPADLEIPVGATGVLVGSAFYEDSASRPAVQRDDLVMLALTDRQRATRITMDTSGFYLRQLLIRAAAAGERIAVYSRDPRRWHSVSQPHIAVVVPGRPAEFVPTILVNDDAGSVPPVGLSATVITVGPDRSSTPADISFHQTSPTTVRIRTATRVLDVAIVEFRQEQTWTGTAA